MIKKLFILFIIIGISLFFFSNSNIFFQITHDKLEIDQANVYGESLNISFNDSFENKINLYDQNGNVFDQEIETNEEIDHGIDPLDIKSGKYFLLDENDQLLTSEEEINIDYYTVTRDNKNYNIKLTNPHGYLELEKSKEKLPDGYYDILIDPGHGGQDVGSTGSQGAEESNLNLEVSLKLKSELEEMGYTVGLTRSDDSLPGDECDGISSYCENGRVSQAYEKHARLYISLHHNTGGGSGFEVYSSLHSSDDLASEIVNQLSTELTPSSKETGMIDLGLYNYTFYDEEYMFESDYYYVIRETGGLATKGTSEENLTRSQSPVGSESILIELGYIDNLKDESFHSSQEVQSLEANLIAKAIDSYLN